MATDRPERCAKQLAGHWASKATVTEDLDRWAQVVALQRFGQRDELEVVWAQRPAGQAAWSGPRSRSRCLAVRAIERSAWGLNRVRAGLSRPVTSRKSHASTSSCSAAAR